MSDTWSELLERRKEIDRGLACLRTVAENSDGRMGWAARLALEEIADLTRRLGESDAARFSLAERLNGAECGGGAVTAG